MDLFCSPSSLHLSGTWQMPPWPSSSPSFSLSCHLDPQDSAHGGVKALTQVSHHSGRIRHTVISGVIIATFDSTFYRICSTPSNCRPNSTSSHLESCPKEDAVGHCASSRRRFCPGKGQWSKWQSKWDRDVTPGPQEFSGQLVLPIFNTHICTLPYIVKKDLTLLTSNPVFCFEMFLSIS